eukprot:scaffold7349_cov173-Amphora_coffeaeformis.AAC.70
MNPRSIIDEYLFPNINAMLLITIRENDVLYGGRGRRHFHRVANQRFLELVKMSRKEYHESRCKKAVAKRIVNEWKGQAPPGRFLQQDPKTEKWYEIKEAKIMEKTCQALRDLKRERGPAGVKQGITERMVDPWDTPVPYQQMPPVHMQPPKNGQMPGGHQMPAQGHHAYQPGGPWMSQGMYAPAPMVPPGMVPTQMPPPYMARPATAMPSAGSSAGMGQGPDTSNGAIAMKRQESLKEDEKNEWAMKPSPLKGEDAKSEDEKMATVPVVDETSVKEQDDEMDTTTEGKAEAKPESESGDQPKSVEEAANDMEVETLPQSTETLADDEVPAPTPLAEMTAQLAPSVTSLDATEKTEDEATGPLVPSPAPVQETTPEQIPESAPKVAEEKPVEKEASESQIAPATEPVAEASEATKVPAPETDAEPSVETLEKPTAESKPETQTKAEPAQGPTNDTSTENKAEPTKEDSSNKEENKKEENAKGDKKDSAKDGDGRKNGELEAAALLANMFR